MMRRPTDVDIMKNKRKPRYFLKKIPATHTNGAISDNQVIIMLILRQ